jgi:tetrahydromethanopterin S-methyltransferase subunit G
MGKQSTDLDDIAESISDFTRLFAKRFDEVDARFDAVDARVFNIEQKQLEHDKRFDEIHRKIDHIYSLLDSHMKRIEEILVENASRVYQQARMEKWIFQIADKLDLKLKCQ